jgi:uncharacterized protein (PEP-CTERM system associated)
LAAGAHAGGRTDYTNNIEAAEGDGGEGFGGERGFVTEITPGISLHRQGGRLAVDFTYEPRFVIYPAAAELNRVDNELDGMATLEAVENFFYVESRANVSQQWVTPFGARPQSSAVSSDNRYTASSFTLTPYLRGKLFGDNDYLLRNENIWTDSSRVENSEELVELYTNRTTGRFDTPIPYFGYSLEYEGRHSEYDNAPDVDTKIGRAILHHRWDEELIVSLRTGYEKNNFGFEDETGNVLGVGLRWNPGPRTSFSGFWEDHYYGGSYDAVFSHRMSRSVYRLSASRAISTYDDVLNSSTNFTMFDFMRPEVQRANPGLNLTQINQLTRLLLALFSNQAQIVERQDAAFILEGARHFVTFRAFNMHSEAAQSAELLQTGSDVVPFSAVEAIEERGLGVTWVNKLSGSSSFSTDLTRTYSKSSGNSVGAIAGKSVEDTLVLRLTRMLSPKTHGYAGLRFTRSDADEGLSEYDEQAIFAGFHHTF